MSTDFDAKLRSLFDQLAEQVPVTPLPPSPTMARRAAPLAWRRVVLSVAIAAVIAGVAAVTAIRPGDTGPATAPAETSLPVDDSVPLVLFDGEPQRIEWSVITPESSIGEAQISSVAAGPAGFVAVGMGFDDFSDGQGRLWHSDDGETWTEPDHDLFAPQGLYSVAATSDAYYVYATPTPPTEGSPSQPAQLYRSRDGTDWDPIGEPTATPGQLVAVDDVLLRVGMADGGILTSTDALAWSPAELAGDTTSPAAVFFDDRIVEVAGTFYLRSWTDSGVWSIWASPDGMSWSQVAVPGVPGRLTGTDHLLLSVVGSNEEACHVDNPQDDPDAAIAAAWVCDIRPVFDALSPSERDSERISSRFVVPVPMIPGVSAFGNQLVAVAQTQNGTVSVWTSTDAATWTPAGLVIELFDDGAGRGSPDAFWIAAHTDTTIVVPISSNGVGMRSHLIVGRITTAPGAIG